MKKYFIIVPLVVIAIIGIALLRKPSQDSPFRIGGILILSGTGSAWGQNAQKGADLAIEEINANGGVLGKTIQMVHEDNPSDNPKTAVDALRKLQTQGIKLIIGTNWTPSGLAVAPIACQEGILMISPTLGVRDFNEKCDLLFNVWPHDDALSEQLGKYVFEQGYARIAILGSLQEWEHTQSEAVKRGFENAGGTVVSYELPPKDEKEFRNEGVKIKQANPDAVVFTNIAHENLAAKRLRENGITSPFFSILMDNEVITGAEGALENTVVITSFTPKKEFIDRFTDEYEIIPDIGSDTAYDSVMLIKEAIEKTQSFDPEEIKEYLGQLKTYDGASGKLVFDGKRGVTKEPRFMIVKNGKLVPLEE